MSENLNKDELKKNSAGIESREARICEERTLEATRKGYFGANGKMNLIVRSMGTDIISGGYTETEDFEIPTMEENERIYRVGWIYNGLREGVNIEIKLMEFTGILSVVYDGHLVYSECSGELLSYRPGIWEEKVEYLYKTFAHPLTLKKRDEYKKEELVRVKSLKNEFLEKMREKWGF